MNKFSIGRFERIEKGRFTRNPVLTVMFVLSFICSVVFAFASVGCIAPKPEIMKENITDITNITQAELPGLPEQIMPEKEDISKENISNITKHPQPPQQEVLASPCENLTGYNYTVCLAVETGNISVCENDTCILSYARQTGNEEACEELSTEPLKGFCKSIVSGRDKCSVMSGTAIDICYMMLAPEFNRTSYCKKISKENEYMRDCYAEMAILRFDYQVCNYLENSYYRDYCYREYSMHTGDTTPCELLFVESGIPSCYKNAALMFDDPRLCNGITSDRKRQICYNEVFYTSETLDIDACKGIGDELWLSICIEYAAVKSGDPSLCYEIADETKQQECLENFI